MRFQTSLALAFSTILAATTFAQPVDEAAKLVTATAAPARFADHKPKFSFATETIDFKAGDKKSIDFIMIKDGDKYVAALHPGMNQLDMITFNPTKTVEKPPFKDYYAWGTLLGVRITTAAWYPEMWASGKVSRDITVGDNGATLRLKTTQTWTGERNGDSTFDMTLRCDPVLGYVWDITTDLAIDKPFTNPKGEFLTPEFFNWQVRVTKMGRRNNQPWPESWDHERTVFHRSDDKLVGFFMNPEANDRGPFKRTDVKEGGYVAKLPGPEGWGVALAHLEKGASAARNNTCNMWADSHNYLKLPKSPDADGKYRIAGKWRFQALPPETVKFNLDNAQWDRMGVK